MKATGYSTWQGTWKEGVGTLSTESETLKDKPYSFSSRFEGTPGGVLRSFWELPTQGVSTRHWPITLA